MAEGMVILEVIFSTTAEQRDDFLAHLRAVTTGSLAEPGCVTYRPSISLDDPLTIHLLEIWDSEAAYLAHREGAPIKAFKGALPGCGKVSAMVRRTGVLQPYEPPVH